MSHPISSLAWLPRAAALASPTASAWRGERPTAAPTTAAAAPVSAVQQLGAAVQTAVAVDSGAATPAAATVTSTARPDADQAVQRFAQALMVALQRTGREGGGDDDDDHERHHHHHGHGHHHGRGQGREHEGLRAYRSMDTLAQRLGALATQLRQGAAPAATPPGATATTATPPAATPLTGARSFTAIEPVIDTAAPTDAVAAGSTPAGSSTATATAAPPSPQPDPLQRLLDAFGLLTPPATPAAGTTGSPAPATDAASPRERLASFLEQLASLLAPPGRRAANDGCGCSAKGSLLNLAA